MKQSEIYDLNTLTYDRKLFRINSQYMIGSKLAKTIAMQDIRQHCEETNQMNYLKFLSLNPKQFVKNYTQMPTNIVYILSESAIQYLNDFQERQHNREILLSAKKK